MNRGICNVCGRFFIKKTRIQDMCDECFTRDKQEYDLVKEYIISHNRPSIMDIYYETNIPLKTIKRFIRERRIAIK